jgi:hypothetical protein
VGEEEVGHRRGVPGWGKGNGAGCVAGGGPWPQSS